MKRIITAVLLLTLAGGMRPEAAVRAAEAVVVDGQVSMVVEDGAALTGDGDTERWWGVAGAIICGAGLNLIRQFWPVALSVPVTASTIGGCILAAMDVAST